MTSLHRRLPVLACPRCGEVHVDVPLYEFPEPVESWTHHATCPVSGAPVLLRFEVA